MFRTVALIGMVLLLAGSSARADLVITKSATAPGGPDVLLAFDTEADGSQNYFTIARGGGSSGVGGGESAYGQTFRFDQPILLDKITLKVRIKPGQDVSGKSLLLWFGRGFTGQTSSGMSSLLIDEEAALPAGMGTAGDVWYLTADIEDQQLEAGLTYAFLPRFGTGGGGSVHPEMEVGFLGTYAYDGGAAFTFDGTGYSTILNNEMAFALHGSAVPEPGTLGLTAFAAAASVGLRRRRTP